MKELLAALVLSVGIAPLVNSVDSIEENTFGDWGSERTCFIYRDIDGTICDWKWTTANNTPVQVRPGLWLAVWREADGKIYAVKARTVTRSRTLRDVELTERSWWPESRRRRLQ